MENWGSSLSRVNSAVGEKDVKIRYGDLPCAVEMAKIIPEKCSDLLDCDAPLDDGISVSVSRNMIVQKHKSRRERQGTRPPKGSLSVWASAFFAFLETEKSWSFSRLSWNSCHLPKGEPWR